MVTRKIIHVDMDAFYASVEQRDNPKLKGKPVAVGGSKQRGVVATASYEARKFGVYSAMPSITASRKCPELIFVKPRFEVYKSVSNQILRIFHDYTDRVEPLSLDEAFLDVTHNKKGISSAALIAREIKKQITSRTHLTASAGISINKFLAKIASDLDKPDGLSIIPPKRALSFIEQLRIEMFFGVGKVTARKMKDLGIHTGKDLKTLSEPDLVRHFRKNGSFFFQIARGIDNREVSPERLRKSISAENTFEIDLTELDAMTIELKSLTRKVFKSMEKNQIFGKTLTLKIKFKDFTQITRSKTVPNWITNQETLNIMSEELLNTAYTSDFEVRLLGLGISNLDNSDQEALAQLTLDL